MGSVPESGPAAWYFPTPEKLSFDPSGAIPMVALATENGLYISTDLGITWTRMDQYMLSHDIHGLAWSGDKLYAATAGQGIVISSGPLQ